MSLLLIIFHHFFIFFDFCFLVFVFVRFFFGFSFHVFLFFCLILILCVPSLVSLSVTHLCFLMFPFVLCFFCVSRLNVLVFFSPCSSSFPFLCFLLPRPPPALEKDNHGTKKQLSHFVCVSGIFAKRPFAHYHCLFCSLVDFFCPQNMFVLDILGICFEGVRNSLLLLICCYIVLLVFGEKPSFGPTCLL